MKLFNLEGQTALVTGGGRGIGKAIALALAEAGANVALTSRTESELKAVCEEIEHSKIDVIGNGAGMNVRGIMLDLTEEEMDFVMDVNLKSVYLVSKAVIPQMKKQQSGKIINIASLTSEIAFPNMPVYAASKGGVSQLTKAMAVEYAKDGIKTNAIGPGYFKTEMTKVLVEDEEKVKWMESRIPLNRVRDVEDLHGSAIFLASKASDYITGQTIYVDGGWLIS